MIYVIHCNEDKTECGMNQEEHLQPWMLVGTRGEELKIVYRFEADSYEEANKVYKRYFGFD